MTKDFLKGNPAKLIFFFAIPYLIGSLFHRLYNTVDTVIVGRAVGVDALAAVGACGSLVWFFMGAISGVTTGFSALVAQRFGAGDMRDVKHCFGNSLILTVTFSAIQTILGLSFIPLVLRVLKTDPLIIGDSLGYMRWILIGLTTTALYNILANMLRALGDSKTPLHFLIIGCISNIALDLLFIVKFDMGPAGAGLATVIAQLISGFFAVRHVMKKVPELHFSLSDLKPDAATCAHLLHIGLPMAFLNMVLSIGGIIITFANNNLGKVYTATYSAAAQIEGILIEPILAFGAAAAVFAAQNYGAGKYARIRKGIRQTLAMAYGSTAICTIFLLFAGKYILFLITKGESQELIDNGFRYLIINSALSVILVPLAVTKCVIQSIGRAFVPVFSGFVEIFCRAAASIGLSSIWGFTGVCLANPAAWLGGLIPIAIDYFLMIRDFGERAKARHGYNVLITGASSGIGEALACACAARGVKHLFLCGRNRERLDSVAAKCRKKGAAVRADVVDVADESATRAWIASCEAEAPLELVFSNAGVATGPETQENVRRTFAINVGGGLNVVLPVIDIFRAAPERRVRQIVITASIAGYAPLATCPAYSGSKAAMKTWGLSLRGMLKREGIRVNVVCPGFVRSRITDKNTCPMPFFMEADKAAKIILDRVGRNVGLIAFPWPMRFGSWWLSTLPWHLAETIAGMLPEKNDDNRKQFQR